MPRTTRIALIQGALLLMAAALVSRAAVVQLWQHQRWLLRAERQHFVASNVPAPRGAILDETGAPLAESRAMVRLEIAPRELANGADAARALRGLGIPAPWVARATDTRRAWVVLPGAYLPGAAARLTAMRGVYAHPVMQRVYTPREAVRRIIGAVDAAGMPRGGIELALDSLLRGRSGHATVARDPRGIAGLGPSSAFTAPRPGDVVELTINQALQEISERALAGAVTRTHATGGDIVVLDPATGEIRALVSRRIDPRSTGSPALSEPFEPGSTIKPFIAATLLRLHLARPDEMINTENGRYTINGRTITDDHPAAELSLSDVIRYSSNIGITKFAARLTPRQEYEALRDFGFGTVTGIDFPGEASGTLRRPERWSKQSAASLAFGYEIAVTPLQLALAYGALANGGTLLAPSLVKEIRAPDGRVLFTHTPQVVRRVIPPAVAAAVRRMLVGVVQGGTGKEAALGNFTLAGKSGTARRIAPGGGGYAPGAYTATFVALFPADRPQYVIVVKLDHPRSDIYAGHTAAPVSKIVLEAAVAARDAALDRRALAASESSMKVSLGPAASTPSESTAAHASTAGIAAPPADTIPDRPIIVSLPLRHPTPHVPRAARAVPDVRGLPVRAAAAALYRAGFEVDVAGLGDALATSPAAGTSASAGTTVRIEATP